jgi:hypothetical protein
MKAITYQMLVQLDACEHQLELFKTVFGESADVTEENALRAIASGLDIHWFTQQLPIDHMLAFRRLSQEAVNRYNTIQEAAWTDYMKVVSPIWNKYLRCEQRSHYAMENRRISYAEKVRLTRTAYDEYESIQVPAHEKYRSIRGPAWSVYERAVARAFVEACQMRDKEMQ